MERLIKGIRGSNLNFLGGDFGCSVENGLERDEIACRGPGQSVVVAARNNWSGSGKEESDWAKGV